MRSPDRTVVRKFRSFEEAQAADAEEDAARTIEEKLAAVEALRRRVYGDGYADAARLTNIPAVSFSSAWKRRVVARFPGLDVPVIGLDDLLANKRAAGRLKDLADVDALEAARARRSPPPPRRAGRRREA